MVKCCSIEDRTVVAYCCRKTKKLICGMEGENVVAYGRLPFTAHNIATRYRNCVTAYYRLGLITY